MADTTHRAAALQVATVAGTSLLPVIPPGAQLLFDPRPARLRPGDLVVFRDLVHRLLWIDPLGGLWHSGEKLGAPAGRELRRNVRGVVVAVVTNPSQENPPAVPDSARSRWDRALAVARGVRQRLPSALWRRVKRLLP